MEQWLLAGMVLFAVIRILSTLISKIFRFPLGSSKHASQLILLTHNSQSCVEWVIRSYIFQQYIAGRPSEVICFDSGSSDDTDVILQQLQRKYPFIRIRPNFKSRKNGMDELKEIQPSKTEHIGALVLDLRN
ncbi:hypothetical protein [Melghirimyces algeriensis]|uniref:Glycosyl transferase family 2 n=1 Tax=Melghirimyces algeriensis TaxID=910412 RepID=A0A521D3V4_9BACL|nr:hypothetical protein [Melghirimyces algeriensis]SMO66368.1 hypothetical protein SAMN06264849_105101 [Melghirimyces algeriensis]